MNRREFLKGATWMGAAAMAAGCVSKNAFDFGVGGAMHGFTTDKFRKRNIRVGVAGLGSRGGWAVRRMSNIPGIEIVAVCDKKEAKINETLKWRKDNGLTAPIAFHGEEGWKAMCEYDGIDAVYVCTPWFLHVPIALRGLNNGKMAFVEVPAAFTVDECWELVETSEKCRLPCIQLENCVYGEIEMLEFNMAKMGILGELTHGEGAYIHDLRNMTNLGLGFGESEWRYQENRAHKGNRYPTHGLVPLCLTFDINRGDRFDYLVSLESQQANHEFYKSQALKKDDPRYAEKIEMGDMNTTLLKTYKGKSILIQHDVSTPRPYSRIQLIQGTKGAITDYPFRVSLEKDGVHRFHREWFEEKDAEAIREMYKHPIWKQIGEIAKKSGGHGGMDFIMDLRWAYCLQNGLPIDTDVYDLATTCSLCELTEKSVRNRSRSYDVPDFTRGAWKTTKPLEVASFDMSKIDFSAVKAGDKPMTL